MTQKSYSRNWGGKTLTIEIGRLAKAANGSCVVRYGDTVLLATAVMAKEAKPNAGFFPLMVEFEERLYAAGRIKGSRFIKREGKPTDEAVLTSRFIDRAIRPLFDKRMENDVQVIVTALAFDGKNDADIPALIAASCALHISDIPWNGPLAGARIALGDGEKILNPTYEERARYRCDIDVAGTKEKTIMLEASCDEAREEDVFSAIVFGQQSLQPVIELIEEVRRDVGKEKADIFRLKTDAQRSAFEKKTAVATALRPFLVERIHETFFNVPHATKAERSAAKDALKKASASHLTELGYDDEAIKMGLSTVTEVLEAEITRRILDEGRRVDGRGLYDIRPLFAEAAVLPCVHGSALFERGETQVLSVCTLGAPGDKQTLDGMELVGEKRFMHHYNFPPYAVGEAKPVRGTGRREIGHGALAEKALAFMIPEKESFPYAIRVVSETLGSNGSSSMASTCGATLALMDAGVPIKAPVGGIAMGLASDGSRYQVITDLQDLEDGEGGMDFKITGTRKGITAIQLDTKTDGLPEEIIRETLTRAHTARMQVLDVMQQALTAPRAELSPNAPRILQLTIHPDKIREVIGSGGKTINEIIAKTGVITIDIEQTGLVMITAATKASADAAYTWIYNLTREVTAGELFQGKVTRIMDFGAFVEVLPGKEGLVHISELAPWRVEKPQDIVTEGALVHVKVLEIDEKGRINLSMKKAEGNTYTDEMRAKAQKSPAPQAPKPAPRQTP